MKKTDTLQKAVASVLFLALAVYLFAWLWRSTHENIVTAPVIATTVSDSIRAQGIAVRAEEVLVCDNAYVTVLAQDGRAVSKGGALAAGTDSEEALERSSRIAQLELEIRSLETILNSRSSASDMTSLDASIRAAVRELSAGTARGETQRAEEAAMELKSLVFDAGDEEANEARLEELNSELKALIRAGAGLTQLTAPEAGLFSKSLDGFEGLSPSDLENLTVRGYDALLSAEEEPAAGAYGKLVTGQSWYFAAVMDDEHAARLAAGDGINLTFSRYYGGDIPSRVVSVSAPENGRCAVVFSSKTALSQTLSMRRAGAEVVFSQLSGLEVPTRAVHVDDGGTYVYCITAQVVEKKYVDIIETMDNSYLIAVGEEADSLREGNTIIVSGSDVYEGRVIDP